MKREIYDEDHEAFRSSVREFLERSVIPNVEQHAADKAIPREFWLEAGKQGLIAGKSGPTTREQQLEAEVADLTQALGEAAIEIRVWKKSAEGRLGPSKTSR